MNGFEVLPSALAEAAQAVRAFAHEVQAPLPAAAPHDPVLAAAWAGYTSGWDAASYDLSAEAVACGTALVTDAQQYAGVESALVPRALR